MGIRKVDVVEDCKFSLLINKILRPNPFPNRVSAISPASTSITTTTLQSFPYVTTTEIFHKILYSLK